MRGLYIHIPFCNKICAYCDFRKTVSKNLNIIEKYIDSLNEEILSYKDKYSDVSTIYIGGGTPNYLPINLLTKLFDTIDIFKENLNIVEYSIEINPDLLTLDQAKLFKKHNINRISIGAESFNDDILLKLGRTHKRETIFNAVKLLKSEGLNNINIDLIFAHPYDNLNLVKENLENFYKLDVPHISYYSMILEENTIFSYMYKHNQISLIDEDLSADMYEYIIFDLEKHGYNQYEISNYARKGFESKHNMIYWRDLEYIGCGLNASGYLDKVRYTNSSKFDKYYIREKEIEKIDDLTNRNEFMMLGLRMNCGVSKSEFLARFGASLDKYYDLSKYVKEGLIEENENYIRLTHKGMMLGDLVFMEFV